MGTFENVYNVQLCVPRSIDISIGIDPVVMVSSRLSHFYIKQVKSVLDNRDFG